MSYSSQIGISRQLQRSCLCSHLRRAMLGRASCPVLSQGLRPHLGYATTTIGADLALPLPPTWERPRSGSAHARSGRRAGVR